MEDWVHRALARWPNVPHLYGWLGLTRRGQWTIKGEAITRPQIVDTINANYAADARGCWYFQNGPQRGYVTLEAAPLIVQVDADGERLHTHSGLAVTTLEAAWLDETGALWLVTAHGPALLADADLGWALDRLHRNGGSVDEAALAAAMGVPAGKETGLHLGVDDQRLAVRRLDQDEAGSWLGFVDRPEPSLEAQRV